MKIRWKVACINWSHPDAPHAISYALRDGEMIADEYHATWYEAMERANRWASQTGAVALMESSVGGGPHGR